MKTNVKTLAKILALSAGCSLVAMSHADNTITFTGTVADTTCTASIDNGVSSIELGTTSVADLKANTYSAAKSFSFTLTGCPAAAEGGASKARITFGGESDTYNSDYFKNQATGTPATNVAIAIFDNAGLVQKNNTEGSDVDISSGEATIPYTVKMAKAGTADPTKGPVKTTVTYNVTYY
ncbi:MAG: fimbrial protein [Klebsiella michiganensis]|uniref:fimbrial protein n=1 Tax=Klebsiella grimontii TaxID=2058152 RepID=UPI00193AB6F5|nr:fimbrial protein [Klebsiella grimontii]MBW5984252.1 fimbrial protein [Klebsiella michiganensis]MBM1115505.1 fimbrial protein [Klebsiella grimontii]MBW6001158.1 fimbrial protein [Klebsiella michiganensis]MBZ6687403.1 type 1 fimbrial protein [Klebsiella grimontii]MBZ7345144.1 type 1 fimbrial protein [Klebsiella grimontii]